MTRSIWPRAALAILCLVASVVHPARADAPACPADFPPGNGFGTVAVAVDSSTPWQPPGGEVRFVLSGEGVPAADMQAAVSFRWHHNQPGAKWITAAPVRIIATTGNSITLGVQVPGELRSGLSSAGGKAANPLCPADTAAIPNVFGYDPRHEFAWTGFGIIPLADMHVSASSATGKWRVDSVEQVGITNRALAGVPAVLAIALAWWLFLQWGKTRGVQGGLFLRLISGPDGHASLSQLQIMVWTLVLATGVTYVIALSGNLIDIPTTTLALLGVTGVTAVGARLPTAGSGAASMNPPGAVTGLAVIGQATDQKVVLSWSPAAGADPSTTYTIQYRAQGTPTWTTASQGVAAPPYAVTGLQANTGYEFQVFGTNAGGSGPACRPELQTIVAAPPQAASAPAEIAGLIAVPAARPESDLKLTWATHAATPDQVVVQYRTTGTVAWATASSAAASPFILGGLDAATDYEIQVYAVTQGVVGPPSALATASTGPRMPKWSDLVVIEDGQSELDVTRLQMLLFTLIAAFFMALKLFDDSQIPDIPTGILALIGLSNGVYLTAKFVPSGR
jgi:hypothetical protein